MGFEILNATDCSGGVVSVFCSEGGAFYLRTDYLETVGPERIRIGESFDSEGRDDILNAGLCFAAEMKAAEYLARAEQCRFRLRQKLMQKGMLKKQVERALDYLERRNILSDERFSSAWLRSHSLSKLQGKTRLLSELLSRGIDRSVANKSLDAFFEENSEEDFCRRAYERAAKQGKNGERLVHFMVDAGFSYKMIKKVAENL